MSWRPHPRRARTSTRSPRAWATGDKSGFVTNLEVMQYQYQWQGTRLQCQYILDHPRYIDVPSEFLRTIKIPRDPDPIINARPEPYSVNEFMDTALYAESGQVLRNEADNEPLINDSPPGVFDDGNETIP